MAVQDPSTNYGWNVPANGGDTGAWGNMLRTIIADDATGIDAVVKAVSDAAMPKAGGTFTGEVKMLELNQTVVAKGTVSGAVSIDYSAGYFQHLTLNGSATFTFTNPPASGTLGVMRVEVNTGGAIRTVTWPASVVFTEAATFTSLADGISIFEFSTRDGGTTWRGRRDFFDAA